MIKKSISLIMAIVLLFSVVACFSINAYAEYPSDIPIIYIIGQGSPLGIKQEDGTYEPLTYKIDKAAITKKVLDNKDIFLKAFLTQNWADFDDLIVEIMTDLLKEIALDENGEPKDGSKVAWDPSVNYCKNRLKNADKYGLMTFVFYYDWRLDPKENMDELRDYIDTVLEATGKDKFALCGRCEGACLILQYLNMFPDDERLTDVIMYASAALGASPLGEVYAGEMYIDPNAVERFIYDTNFGINKDLGLVSFTDESLREILTIVSNVYGLDLGCWAVNNVYEQIYLDVVPEAMINSYASLPGYWTMVADKYYDKAKQNVFGGEEEKYAKLIEKIDDYHSNIAVRTEEILKDAQNSGIEVYNVVKYGKAMAPVTKECDKHSDMICTVEAASWGATSALITDTFSKEYLAEAEQKGTAKYISPDKCIDASTTFLKDTTWFVKNLSHKNFPACVEALIFAQVNNDNMTVETSESFPQYLYYDEDNNIMSPLDPAKHITKMDIYNGKVPKSIPRRLKPMFKLFYLINVFIIKTLMPKVKTGN